MIKNLKLHMAAAAFAALALAGIADALVPGHSLLSVSVPFILVLAAYSAGMARFRPRLAESLALIILNGLFLFFTCNSKLLILNVFVLSYLLWNLITPFTARFKQGLYSVIAVLILISFVIPYYKMPIPLLPLLYYPFYMLGHMHDRLEIRRNRLTDLLYGAAAFFSLSAILGVLIVLFKLRSAYGLVFVQSLFKSSILIVYSPFIVIGFLVLILSVYVLSGGFSFLKGAWSIEAGGRPALYTSTLMLPLLYALFILHLPKGVRYCLIPVTAAAFVLLYMLSDKLIRRFAHRPSAATKAEMAAAGEHRASAGVRAVVSGAHAPAAAVLTVDANKVFLRLLFKLGYILFIVLSIEFVMHNSSFRGLLKFMSTPSFAYNLLFVGMFYLFVTALLGVRLGTPLTALVHIVVFLANFIKVKYFSEPFFPWDIYLISTALKISRDYISLPIIAALAAVFAGCLVLAVKYRRKIGRFLLPKPNVLLALFLVIPILMNLNMLSHNSLKDIKVLKDWYDGMPEYQRNGTYVEDTLYLQRLSKYFSTKPAGYSSDAMKAIKDKYAVSENASSVNADGIKPNVVLILSESFWDPENLKGVQFSKPVDTNLKKYRSGSLVSPKFGGYTANIEFEILTGLSTFFFNPSIIPYTVYFKRDTPSIVSAFRDDGYSTVAIHPNGGAMYNRNNVYKYMGFENFKDIKSFDTSADLKGNYVSDDKFANKVIETLNEGSGPKFILGITMQNHDPYPENIKKYGASKEIQVQSDKLNDVEKDILGNYSQGIYDADKSLGKLIDRLKESGKPTLLVFFGDHLPRLGLPEGIYDIYNKLGYTDPKKNPAYDLKFFETPLVVWSNYKDLGKQASPISPNQLSVEILRDAGVKYPSYFNMLLALREKYPWLNRNLQPPTSLEGDSMIKEYEMIQYDILFGKQYLVKN